MKHLPIVLLIIILSGCGSPDPDSPHSTQCNTLHETTYDTVGSSGLILKASKNMYVALEQLDQYYKDTQACMGMSTQAPTLLFRSFKEMNLGGGWGVYHFAGLQIYINTDEDVIMQRNCKSDRDAFKHEAVHHILHLNGVSISDNANHAHEMFSKCGPGPRTENGVPI